LTLIAPHPDYEAARSVILQHAPRAGAAVALFVPQTGMAVRGPQQRFLQHKWRLAIGYSETLGLHLAHLINDSSSGVRHRLVPFFQEFGENGKVLYWILRGL
jgi:hypothetical protein